MRGPGLVVEGNSAAWSEGTEGCGRAQAPGFGVQAPGPQ